MPYSVDADGGFSLRKFRTEEHSLNLNRLSQRNPVTTHTTYSTAHFGMCPFAVVNIGVQVFTIDVIQPGCCLLLFRYTYFKLFAHKMITVVHLHIHGYCPVNIVEFKWGKIKPK